MEQQEMLTAWKELQIRVENLTAIQMQSHHQVHKNGLMKTRGRTLRSPISDLIVASILAIVIGNFVATNSQALVAAPIAALPAFSIFAFAIMLINFSVRQMILSSSLDYSTPIIEAQTLLAQLRKLKIQASQWAFNFAMTTWFAFPLLAGQILVSPKLFLALNPIWIVANVAIGLATIPIVNWFLRKSRFASSLQNEFAGKDILEAERFLDDIEKFKLN